MAAVEPARALGGRDVDSNKTGKTYGPGQFPLVELPAIEPARENALTCGNIRIGTRNDAKVREMTCGYSKVLTASTHGASGNGHLGRFPGLPTKRLIRDRRPGRGRDIPRRIHGVRLAVTSTARSDRRIAVRGPGVGVDASLASADAARAP